MLIRCTVLYMKHTALKLRVYLIKADKVFRYIQCSFLT